jgi:hypothetical protein
MRMVVLGGSVARAPMILLLHTLRSQDGALESAEVEQLNRRGVSAEGFVSIRCS